MKYEIEVYKGQTIEYDDEYDKFICDISIEDKWKSVKRQSLKQLRNEIDQFIKKNLEFKPFKIIHIRWSGFEIHTVEAIRIDGSFIVSGRLGKSFVKPEGIKKDYKMYDPEIEKQFIQLYDELEKSKKKFSDSKEKLFEKLLPVDISQYENKI